MIIIQNIDVLYDIIKHKKVNTDHIITLKKTYPKIIQYLYNVLPKHIIDFVIAEYITDICTLIFTLNAYSEGTYKLLVHAYNVNIGFDFYRFKFRCDFNVSKCILYYQYIDKSILSYDRNTRDHFNGQKYNFDNETYSDPGYIHHYVDPLKQLFKLYKAQLEALYKSTIMLHPRSTYNFSNVYHYEQNYTKYIINNHKMFKQFMIIAELVDEHINSIMKKLNNDNIL